MSNDQTNKKFALIIGSSRGIGKAVAISLAKQGYTNILVSRNLEGMQDTKRKCDQYTEAFLVQSNINEDQKILVEQITKLTDSLNLLWLGAAGWNDSSLEKLSDNEIDDLLNTGYLSLVKLTRNVYSMLKKGEAFVFGACSDWSNFGSGGPSVFGSSKVALAGFLDKLKDEAQKDNIKAVTLKLGDAASAKDYELEDTQKQIDETGYSLLSMEDIADTINFVLSRKTGYVSEVTIVPRG
jgi:NADP-dependent 3-hydroxy acid dehydrogenase YdfG